MNEATKTICDWLQNQPGVVDLVNTLAKVDPGAAIPALKREVERVPDHFPKGTDLSTVDYIEALAEVRRLARLHGRP